MTIGKIQEKMGEKNRRLLFVQKIPDCKLRQKMIYSTHGVPMTGWQPPEPVETGFPEYIGGEVVCMTAYEIIMIFLGIIGLLISFGGLLITLLAFLDQRDKRD